MPPKPVRNKQTPCKARLILLLLWAIPSGITIAFFPNHGNHRHLFHSLVVGLGSALAAAFCCCAPCWIAYFGNKKGNHAEYLKTSISSLVSPEVHIHRTDADLLATAKPMSLLFWLSNLTPGVLVATVLLHDLRPGIEIVAVYFVLMCLTLVNMVMSPSTQSLHFGFVWKKQYGHDQKSPTVPAIRVSDGQLVQATREEIQQRGLAITYRWDGRFKKGLTDDTVHKLREKASAKQIEFMFVDRICCAPPNPELFSVNYIWYSQAKHHWIICGNSGIHRFWFHLVKLISNLLGFILFGMYGVLIYSLVVLFGANVKGRDQYMTWVYISGGIGAFITCAGGLVKGLSRRMVHSLVQRAWIAYELLSRYQGGYFESELFDDRLNRLGIMLYTADLDQDKNMAAILSNVGKFSGVAGFNVLIDPQMPFVDRVLKATENDDLIKIYEPLGEEMKGVVENLVHSGIFGKAKKSNSDNNTNMSLLDDVHIPWAHLFVPGLRVKDENGLQVSFQQGPWLNVVATNDKYAIIRSKPLIATCCHTAIAPHELSRFEGVAK